ncbi:elongation factor 1-beta [Methanothermobacter wolfeii]|uniref:Elongation factor 1-beta n=1 Tax=Methanothermobacter wolfeii TaxID=145261 RepID=A0A9E7RVB2_METWO|nr:MULTISPECIES: elongation factor 1-beta [Methanothermobacter]NLM02654.1 elongation factor 1-beta [Methanothermobacter wolfeii]QHN05812.1 elongation factor 1-beta [Methanothermobacter sp. THM-1]UXH31963.1 elongation factor 1-beta [Methanothermobacter wolfeii]SCM55949.1 Elongation factor 1-beta [Methanothermobacter wolfeii]
MGEVVATIKLMPESPEVDLEALKKEVRARIPEGTELHRIDEEPIAFGLVALNVMVVVDDAEGGTEAAEENLAGIEGISNIEVTDVRRLM